MAEKKSTIDQKKEYHKKISQRIRYAMDKLNFTQSDIIAIANEKDYSLKQSALSKMLSDNCTNMAIKNVAELADILCLDLNELLSFSSSTEITIPDIESIQHQKHSLFIKRADDQRMLPYLNSFYTYFFPTKSSDENILKGKLRFYPSPDKSKCLAHLEFKTGIYNEKNEPIQKTYDGQLILSPIMSAAYCSFMNEDIGEISYILFQYIPILYEKLQCRVALVLTSSAGDHRMPTVHRMIFSRDSIPEESLQILQGQLFLNESEILISEMGLEKFLEDEHLDDSFKSYFCRPNQNTKFAGLSPVPYYRFDESVIRESFLDSNVKIDAINLIRQYSANPKYNKIGSKSDELVYKFIQNLKKETNSNKPKEESSTK